MRPDSYSPRGEWAIAIAMLVGVLVALFLFLGIQEADAAQPGGLAAASRAQDCGDVVVQFKPEGSGGAHAIQATNVSCNVARSVAKSCVKGTVAGGWTATTWDGKVTLAKADKKVRYTGVGGGGCGFQQQGCHDFGYRGVGFFGLEAVGISCGGAWTTEDAGATWSSASKGMWAAYMPPDQRENPAVQDPHRIVRCRDHPDTLWTQHHNAQFRSTDGAAAWSTISETFGFAVAAHPKNAETAWFVPAQKDEFRIPADGDFCVLKTEDGGKSFRRITAGLPPKPCYDLIYRHALDVDAEGRALAFGSTTGNLWASGDSGESWRTVSNHLPPIYCLKFAH